MRSIIRAMIYHRLSVNLISALLITMGAITFVYFSNVDAYPDVNLDHIHINVSHPGLTAEEVEVLILNPIEQELRAINGINDILSMAFSGSAKIIIEADPKANNRHRLSSEILLAIKRSSLPEDLPQEPIVTEVDGSVFPLIRLSVSADVTNLELLAIGDELVQGIQKINGVSRVLTLGDPKAEIKVKLDPVKMDKYRISFKEVAGLIRKWNLNSSGGLINTESGQKNVRILGEFLNASELEQLVLRANYGGVRLRLSDIATVEEGIRDNKILYDVSGQPALSMIVFKKLQANTITTVDKINSYLATKTQWKNKPITVTAFQDSSKFTRIRLDVLTNNGGVGLILVFVAMLLFLRLPVAVSATMGLPVVILTGVFVLYVMGVSLNLISMIGFVVVIGMLVDDAIIVAENISWHIENGATINDASVNGAIELIGPVTTTVLTTLAAFIPMMFMTGTIGKFIIAIPIVVILLLILSWLETFCILPTHIAHLYKSKRLAKKSNFITRLESGYERVLIKILSIRWIVLMIVLMVGAGALYLAKSSIPFHLFPSTSIDEYVIRVRAETGTGVDEMRKYLRDIDLYIKQSEFSKYIEATLAKSGEISIDEGDSLTQRGGRYGQIRVMYIPSALRPEHNTQEDMQLLSTQLSDIYPHLDIALTEIGNGPPVGRALEVQVEGLNYEANQIVANKLIKFLSDIEGVRSIDSGLTIGDKELHIRFNQEFANYTGIEIETASEVVRSAISGLKVSSVRRDQDKIDISIEYKHEFGNIYTWIGDLKIPNDSNGLVPLSKVAYIEENIGPATVRHHNTQRVINVVADVDKNIISSLKLNQLVKSNQYEWLGKYSDQVTIVYDGEDKSNKESFNNLIFALIVSILAIFIILTIQFNSVGYPFAIILMVPLGFVGVILSFYLHNLLWAPISFSFFSSLGMIALTGVVVNNSLVLLVFVKKLLNEGKILQEAIVLAGKRRIRSILLTTLTTMLGLLPAAYGWNGVDPFISPMALAMAWGIAFSTLVTLFILPACISVGDDIKRCIINICFANKAPKLAEESNL